MKSKLIRTIATLIVLASIAGALFLVAKRPVSVEYVRPEPQEAKLEDVIQQRAESWLKGPEALEYAKTKVTAQIVDELGKK